MFNTKEKELAYHRAYRERNKERIKARQKLYDAKRYPKRLRPCAVCKEPCAGFKHRRCEFQSVRASTKLSTRMGQARYRNG